ncbi:MAG: MMPL family transporter [Deltaproteobacteria bacterium]|nr:MMPL family transporter [Deltaproteobacteria bacterium]
MKVLVFILNRICKLSVSYPYIIVAVFTALGIAGFWCMPRIVISTDLISGIGETDSIITLSKQNNDIFGEQDSLIVALEFPEAPGSDRLKILSELGEAIGQLTGVRRVRYRWLDPTDKEQTKGLFKNFLLGMNERERKQVQKIFSPQGIKDAVRRNVNHLFLVENSYLQDRLLEDPLELGQFVSRAMEKRLGSISLTDIFLLISSPDSTVFLIQVTPTFPSPDIVQGKQLMNALVKLIPEKMQTLASQNQTIKEKFKDLKWDVTGKTAFHQESDRIFDQETFTILMFSFASVCLLLVAVYRSLWAALALMAPIAAGVGPNYGLIYLSYSEVNPVVMGATGVLFGLGTDYGVHLWNRLKGEMEQGLDENDALFRVYDITGPAIITGAMTSILAFLCLCLSDQPAMAQFGYVGATGLLLTLVSTLFLFPSIVTILRRRNLKLMPTMHVSFKAFSGLYKNRPVTILITSVVVLIVSSVAASRLTYENDLFKVFLARGMESMSVSNKISQKFHANFSQPTLLSFDVDNVQDGLVIQRKIDKALEQLMEKSNEISSFDSVSYLMSPEQVRSANLAAISAILNSWPALQKVFETAVNDSILSDQARKFMEQTFQGTERLLSDLKSSSDRFQEHSSLERSWYMALINGRYRFLTQIRYSERVTDPKTLKSMDTKVLDAVKNVGADVKISGSRQVMSEILSGLVSELVRLSAYVFVASLIFFFVVIRSFAGVTLSMIPMLGAFSVTLGLAGLMGYGLPFSIVGVAPLIFGLGMDNGVHVVMGSLSEDGGGVVETMDHVTRPIIFTSLTNVMGFVAMLTSKHYSMEFLGWAIVIAMIAAVAFTLTTLPAILLLLEKRKIAIPS